MIFTASHYFFLPIRSGECRCYAIALLDDSIRESSRWLYNPLVACAQFTRNHGNYALHEQVVGRSHRQMGRPARRWPPFLHPHDLDCFAATSSAL
jgi:hypothetical protein